MRETVAWTVLLVLTVAGPGSVAAAPEDRLARFHELGRLLSGVGEASEPVDAEAVLAEMFALADGEIIDSLRSGEPFSSPAFIQQQLDAFTGAWGGAAFRVHRLGRVGDRTPLTVGVFTIAGVAARGSVRGYGRAPGGDVALLEASTREGMPEIHAWPPARDGAAQFAATWLGAASGPGGRPLTVEIWRDSKSHGLLRVWSTATPFLHGLSALGFAVDRGAISVRYEARYPGRKPGCDGQTEHVDLYRFDARRDTVSLVARRILNGWHRDLQGAMASVLTALATGDQATLSRLVPERALRTRLPRRLAPEPACDQVEAGAPTTVTVAATEERYGRLVPWSLTWRRAPRGWRLAAAAPMLQ